MKPSCLICTVLIPVSGAYVQLPDKSSVMCLQSK